MTAQTTTVTDRLVSAMREANWTRIAETYSPDVLLDMNLPTWRFQVQGREAAGKYLVEQAGSLSNLHTTHCDVMHTDDGVVIEEEMRFDGPDGEYLWRAIDIFRVDGDAVIEHIQYCTGCWPPDQVARQAREAPMVRW
jgi:hypothetical protein